MSNMCPVCLTVKHNDMKHMPYIGSVRIFTLTCFYWVSQLSVPKHYGPMKRSYPYRTHHTNNELILFFMKFAWMYHIHICFHSPKGWLEGLSSFTLMQEVSGLILQDGFLYCMPHTISLPDQVLKLVYGFKLSTICEMQGSV